MDYNGDGDISRREFLGTPRQFEELDTDQDGFLTAEEVAPPETDNPEIAPREEPEADQPAEDPQPNEAAPQDTAAAL